MPPATPSTFIGPRNTPRLRSGAARPARPNSGGRSLAAAQRYSRRFRPFSVSKEDGMASNEGQPDFSDVRTALHRPRPSWSRRRTTNRPTRSSRETAFEDLEALLRRRQPLAAHLRGQHRHHQGSGRHLPRANPEDPFRLTRDFSHRERRKPMRFHRTTTLALIGCLALFGCKKKDETPPPPPRHVDRPVRPRDDRRDPPPRPLQGHLDRPRQGHRLGQEDHRGGHHLRAQGHHLRLGRHRGHRAGGEGQGEVDLRGQRPARSTRTR